jgi:hypothetical protein
LLAARPVGWCWGSLLLPLLGAAAPACLLACSWDCCGWDLLIPPPACPRETSQAREDPLLTERGEITVVMIPTISSVLLGAAVVILCNCVCLTL